MSKDDRNIDPFNAGEPEMPWDDPASGADDALAEQSPVEPEGDYTAPEKDPDSYVAPQEAESAVPAHAGDRSKAEGGAMPGSREPSSPVADQGGADASKSGEPRQKRSGGCGCMVAVALILLMGTGALSTVGGCVSDIFQDVTGSRSLGDEGSVHYTINVGRSSDQDDKDKAEQEVRETVTDMLDGVKDSDDERAAIVGWLDKKAKAGLGYDAAGLGIDANAFANALQQSFTYKMKSVYAFEGSDGKGMTGSAYYDVSAINGSRCWTDFSEEAWKYLWSQGIKPLSGAEGQPPLTDEQKAHLNGMMSDVLARARPADAATFGLNLSESSDGWTIQTQDYDQNLLRHFGLY